MLLIIIFIGLDLFSEVYFMGFFRVYLDGKFNYNIDISS